MFPSAGAPPDEPLSREQADGFARKILAIAVNGQGGATERRLTPITEAEVNSYLEFLAGPQVPEGIVEPRITLIGEERLTCRATVDLDVVRRRSSGGWLDPFSYLSGKLPVVATGFLRTADGVGRLEVESVTVSGVAVPILVLRELVGFYSRTPTNPDGINLEAPFDLPARIREIRVAKGRAVVVQ